MLLTTAEKSDRLQLFLSIDRALKDTELSAVKHSPDPYDMWDDRIPTLRKYVPDA